MTEASLQLNQAGAASASAAASTWRTKLRALGPGILMATAAVGGSHIVSSTQAGAIYGWQLAILILLINLFKYPFFRFGTQYTAESGLNLIEGYATKGKVYLFVYFVLNVFSAIVNTAGTGILCAAILANIFPASWGLSISQITTMIVVFIWGMLLLGGYRFLDGLSKWIMTALTIATVAAVIIALFTHRAYVPDFVQPSPWQLSALPFMVSLMGWMPAPIEISTLNSMWAVEKRKSVKVSEKDAMFDFNVGYIGTAILAFFFLALGALIQYGNGEPVKSASAAYIAQFVSMYATALGSWARPLITVIAFLCIFGTVLTVIDGYSRANNEALRLLLGREEAPKHSLAVWMTVVAGAGLVIVFLFSGTVSTLLRFAMIASFITTPFFALLNYSLVSNKEHKLHGWLKWLSIVGLVYLFGFALFFIVAMVMGVAY
ncbi:divalent metal cation transporter [bacterium]|nr:divalent metal cation transporter [bacterium]